MNRKTIRENQNPSEALGKGASYPEPSSIYAMNFLERQHVELRDMFAQMKGEQSETGRRRLLERVTTYLRNHSALEERHFYPGVRNEETKKLLAHSLEEHKDAEEGLGKLLAEEFDESFERKFEKLAEDVQHHMRDEEDKLFPEVARTVLVSTLTRIGEEMERSYRSMVLQGPSVADQASTTKKNATD
ncbi:MAG TPA: hemerythrin domain-containing protein [Lacunisphaera sp.]|nr:hemerythrin domain-containing protein [Lacunisphaera sp.]